MDFLPKNTILYGLHGHYRVLEQVGRGTLFVVYRVHRLVDNTLWALKEMRLPSSTSLEEFNESYSLFVQQATIIQSLHHANVSRIIDVFEHEKRPYIVMEFVVGKTLEQCSEEKYKSNTFLSEQQVLSWGIQLCQVMTYLHSLTPPIIYRDLKPSEIMITSDNLLKLINFTTARTYKPDKLTDTVPMGTAGYAPREQYGKAQTDARSDIYALGATLLHLLTNLPPVPLQTPKPSSIRRHNSTVKIQTEAAIIKAMSQRREERFQSAAELERVLLDCLDVPYIDPIALLEEELVTKQALINDYYEETDHLRGLQKEYRLYLRKMEIKAAKFGLHIPIYMDIEIDEITQKIKNIEDAIDAYKIKINDLNESLQHIRNKISR